MPETESAGGLPRSRSSLLTPARHVSVLLDLLDVQYLRFPVRQYARLRRHDLRRGDGTLSRVEGCFSGRKLLVGSLAVVAHGRIRRDHGQGRIPLSHIDAARILSTPVLWRGGMR